MKKKKQKLFDTLAVQYKAEYKNTSIFSIDENPGWWIEPSDDCIEWVMLDVYGIIDSADGGNDGNIYDDYPIDENGDLTSAEHIGTISGYHVPTDLIIDLNEDPYTVCDDMNGDLESMYSVINEYTEDFMDIDIFCLKDIFYIHEIELMPKYQGLGYEKTLLMQLPFIIVKSLRVFPSLLMYYPKPTNFDKQERNKEAEADMVHRMEYYTQGVTKKTGEDKLSIFPPQKELPIKEVNRVLGRRNPGDTVPKNHRNQAIYDLYESAGFMEVGKTGWLYKMSRGRFS